MRLRRYIRPRNLRHALACFIGLVLGSPALGQLATTGHLNDLVSGVREKNAAEAILGAYGRMRHGKFQRQGVPDLGNLPLHITVAKISEEDFRSLRASGLDLFTALRDRVRSEEYKLVFIRFRDYDEVAGNLDRLRAGDYRLSQGLRDKETRLITTVVLVFDHEYQLDRELAVKLAVGFPEFEGRLADLEGTSLTVRFEAQAKKHVEIQLGPGTAVGYKYHRLCWWKKTGDLSHLQPGSQDCDRKGTSKK